MSSLQAQARALGDPSRHGIFRSLTEAGRPLGVAELAERHGLTQNAIRQHLAVLVETELVTESTAPPSGPGRPKRLYAPSPTADSRWGVSGPYERLSRMLAEVIRTGRTPEEVGAEEGRRRAEQVDAGDAAQRLHDAMARDGFDPEVRASADGFHVVLRRCPFESTAVADPATVCSLHLGMARGLTEALTDVEVLELVARDPRAEDCWLRVAVAARSDEVGAEQARPAADAGA